MIKLILAGSHQYTLECYQALQHFPDVQIVGWLPNPVEPSRTEAKMSNRNTAFQVHDQFSGVPVMTVDQLAATEADLLLSVMYSQILSAEQLGVFRLGAWNIHPGLLPAYRGRNILYWTIMNGASEQGLAFHEMVAELDAGRILASTTYVVAPTDTAQDLFTRAQNLIGPFARQCIQTIIQGNYQLTDNDTQAGHLYTTQSVDYSHLNFSVEQFTNSEQASRQLRAVLFPQLEQFPTLTNGTETVTIRSVSDLAHVAAWFKPITVLADGCLDPLHEGHIAYLEAAKALGSRLVVNTVTDTEIWQKRPTVGPFLPQNSRLAVLRGLRAVDEVITMDTLDALRTVRPAVYVKGKDWEGKLPGAETRLCAELGIEIRYLDTVHNSSTTLLKKFIAQLK